MIEKYNKIKNHVGWSPISGIDKGLNKNINLIKCYEKYIKKTLNA